MIAAGGFQLTELLPADSPPLTTEMIGCGVDEKGTCCWLLRTLLLLLLDCCGPNGSEVTNPWPVKWICWPLCWLLGADCGPLKS